MRNRQKTVGGYLPSDYFYHNFFIQTYDYDSFGNVKSTVLSATVGGTEMTETITSSATYSEDGNYLIQTIDSLGNATNYNYTATTKLKETTEASFLQWFLCSFQPNYCDSYRERIELF